MDNSSDSLDKFPLYVALKVPEVLRSHRGLLSLQLLNSKQTGYGEVEQSLVFPQMSVLELPLFIERAREIGQRAAVRELVKQVQRCLEE